MGAKTLVVVVGPTAIGKTDWAITLAKAFGTAVLSADSRQFYREMNIGTAVPSKTALAAVPHFFIQHRSIHEAYTVGHYEQEALALLKELFQKHSVVVMAGGSGLYIDAVVKGLDQFPEVDPAIRENLNAEWAAGGIEHLQTALQIADPEYYSKVDKDNPHRLIRALEVYRASGQPYSSFLGKQEKTRDFNSIFIGLTAEREEIYRRIEQRVDTMVRDGLVAEARRLYSHRHLPALQTVGYRELFDHFENKTALATAVAAIAKNTRRYAKRQLTWFNNRPEIKWFPRDTPESEVIRYIQTVIEASEK